MKVLRSFGEHSSMISLADDVSGASSTSSTSKTLGLELEDDA
eukprot:CAMPEP_0177552080 /NCGR_PEP_ID=MMETSP0369-20130122/66588_1 /TAXON_ID=447022 ORGANISM="Scrippsiella hangoei-like, Strain SHHI-4" /NCGR_SAMPLE_ID=MMETSP0369 /ASSEMBLY_ACC=CAM_ASM_000364 /LENGTH=41 /DNA_ID= /DNA_START= /DNA_END= /DNA_ORIENTATION=